MENIGPIVLFLLYMVISAWAKQRKNKATTAKWDKDDSKAAEEQAPRPASKVESIFEQIKKELFEEKEEVALPMMDYMEEISPEEAEEVIIPHDYEEAPFVEGASSLHDRLTDDPIQNPIKESEIKTNKLSSILKPYSMIQQGILLHEILGKPRAMQKNEEWFHSG